MVIVNTYIHEDSLNERLLNSIHMKVYRDDNNQEVYSKKLQKHNEKIAFKLPESTLVN